MKGKKNRCLAFVLSAAMACSTIPSLAFAASEIGGNSEMSVVVAGSAISGTNEKETITFDEYNNKEGGMYEVCGRNRVDARTDSALPYQDEQTALNSARDYAKETSSRIKMLTGENVSNKWDLTVVKNVEAGAAAGMINADGTENPFAATDYAETDIWKQDVKLPASWTTQGDWTENVNTPNGENEVWNWDYPIYDNVKMPWQDGEQPQTIDGNNKADMYGTLTPGEAPVKYNPIGFYRTTFDVDDLQKENGDRIRISFQGVESAYYVFVNGQAVGYSEDTFRGHEFDITDYLTEDGKNNTLAVRVHKFNDSTWLEDQDMIYDGGIFRDVYLISTPAVSIEDYKVDTDFDEDFVNADLVVTNLKLKNNTGDEIPAGYAVTANLYDDISNVSDVDNDLNYTYTISNAVFSDDETLKIDYGYTGTEPAPTAKILVGTYSGENEEVLENSMTVDLDGTGSQSIKYTKPSSDKKVKVYIWDDLDKVQPLSMPKTVGDATVNTPIAQLSFVTEEAIPAYGTFTFDENKVTVEAPKQWSAEKPNLYYMSMNLKDNNKKAIESSAQLVGFREINFTKTTTDGVYGANNTASYDRITINGQPLFMKGTNRHDSDPFTGKYISKEVYDIDLKTMKQFNINTIRTSHYSNDEYLYYLADTQGFYLMGETNAECHAIANKDRSTAEVYQTILKPIFMDRTETAYQSLKNHSSIVAWSIGNECGGTTDANKTVYYDMVNYFHERDNSRFVHSEFMGSSGSVDMMSNMYPTVAAVNSWATSPEKTSDKNKTNMPYFMCEYDHAMGNAVGDLDGYWDALRSGTNMIGGCIWDWVDQSRPVKLSRVKSSSNNFEKTDANAYKVPTPYDYYKDGKYLAHEDLFGEMRNGLFFGFGGDWGDVNHEGRNVNPDGKASGSGSGQFCVNGLVSPDRQPQPELYQVKYEYKNFWMTETSTYEQQRIAKTASAWTTDDTLKNQQVVVYNENNFTNLNEFNMTWTLKENGEAIANGTVENVPSVEPKQAGGVTIPFGSALPAVLKAGSNYQLYVSIQQKGDKWATNDGFEVAYDQFDLSDDVLTAVKGATVTAATPNEVGGENVSVNETSTSFDVTGANFSFSVSKTTGFLSNYVYNSETVINELKPNYWRAKHDNDSPLIDNWRFANEESNITPVPNAIKVSTDADGRKVIDVGVKINVAYDGNEYAKEFLRYVIDQSGAVTYRMYLDTTNMPNQTAGGRFIPRLGSEMKLDKDYENINWYGNGHDVGKDGEYGYNYPVTECYRDRNTFAVKGVYSSTATDMYFPHMKNQETGTVDNVTWACMQSDAKNTALLVSAKEDFDSCKENDINKTNNNLEVSALHFSTKDVVNGSLHPYEMSSQSKYTQSNDYTYFNVDHKSLGIGNKSCGDIAREDARITPGYIFDYEYTFVPVAKSETKTYTDTSIAWNATKDTDVADPEFAVELGAIGYTTPTAGLPATVMVSGSEKTVTWETPISDCATYESTNIVGLLADKTVVSASIIVVPDNMYYFVDCNDSDDSAFNAIKATSQSMKNTVSDQAYADGSTWGYTSTLGTDFNSPASNKMTAGDIYQTGWYTNSGKNITYQFDLDAGKYSVSAGAYEFWNGNAARTIKVDVAKADGTALGSETMLIDSKNGITQNKMDSGFTLDEATTVTVTVSKSSGADPLLSWIGISQALPYSVSAQDGIVPNSNTGYAGDIITLSGNYAGGSLFITNEKESTAVPVTKNEDGTYSFTMPSSNVSIVGLVNSENTVYVVPSTCERIKVTGETDARNYFIKNNLGIGMTFDIPDVAGKNVKSAKVYFIRQNTAGGQKTNIYDQSANGFAYENGEGYIGQYSGGTQKGLALSAVPTLGSAYKLLFAYDSSVSSSAAGNDYYVVGPVDNSGKEFAKCIPQNLTQIPYIELTLEDK